MAILPVLKYGHPILRQAAQPVKLGDIPPNFIQDMVDTMIERDGAGLAANQVGSLQKILVAVEPNKDKIHILVNPVIAGYSEKMERDTEGCLSLPSLQAQVERHYKIVVQALTPEGEKVEIQARGLFARILQHEIDHLNGVLYIDQADLDTLVWLRDTGEKEYETEPATIAEVQQDFTKRYHTDNPGITFAPAKKA